MSKQKSTNTIFSVTDADYIFHDIMHDNISVREGIAKCRNTNELNKLYALLNECGELDDTNNTDDTDDE